MLYLVSAVCVRLQASAALLGCYTAYSELDSWHLNVTNALSRNVRKELPLHAASQSRT